jgi:hypothetical protein
MSARHMNVRALNVAWVHCLSVFASSARAASGAVALLRPVRMVTADCGLRVWATDGVRTGHCQRVNPDLQLR